MVQELEMDRAIDGLTSESTQGMPPLRVGLLGLGNVGGGTYRVLQRNAALIAARAGRRIAIDKVAVRNVARARQCVGHGVAVTDDPFELVQDPERDVVVESIGGTTVARDLVMAAIAHGKHVVTANKALLALHGDEVFAKAKVQGVIVNYEGAVAVSIPIIKALREAYSANRIDWVAGIVNGTSNFILSEMESGGQGFQAALQDAQRQGFAEQDPTFDVDGIDAAHKLTLLASNAFGIPLSFHRIHVQGIRGIQVRDMECAGRLGYRIKLLAVARRVGEGIDMWVKPVLLQADQLLAQVDGSMNAVMVCADVAGTSMHYGAGAGAEQTASAVIADLVDIARWSGVAREQRIPSLAFNGIAVRAHPVNVTQEVF